MSCSCLCEVTLRPEVTFAFLSQLLTLFVLTAAATDECCEIVQVLVRIAVVILQSDEFR